MSLAALYRDIAETSPDGIWVFDLEGRTIYANPGSPRCTASTSPSWTGSPSSTPSMPRAAVSSPRTWTGAAGHVNRDEVEVQFVRRDGSTMWVLVRESTLMAPTAGDRGPAPHQRLRDRRRIVESLRTSERRLAEAQRIARIGSWEWDLEDDRITASAELGGLFGLGPETSPRRMPVSSSSCTGRPGDRRQRGQVRPARRGGLRLHRPRPESRSGCGPEVAASRCGTRPARSSACPGRTRTSARPSRPRPPCRTR